jgi:hypothetical protein
LSLPHALSDDVTALASIDDAVERSGTAALAVPASTTVSMAASGREAE